MVLLIDTNIILDVLLSRSDFVKESSIIWKLCETEQAKGYISTLTYANMMYIMRKQMTPEQIEDVFRKLKLIFDIFCCVCNIIPYIFPTMNFYFQKQTQKAESTLPWIRLLYIHFYFLFCMKLSIIAITPSTPSFATFRHRS